MEIKYFKSKIKPNYKIYLKSNVCVHLYSLTFYAKYNYQIYIWNMYFLMFVVNKIVENSCVNIYWFKTKIKTTCTSKHFTAFHSPHISQRK